MREYKHFHIKPNHYKYDANNPSLLQIDDKKYINRNTIRRIKKSLVINDEKFKCLKDKFCSDKGILDEEEETNEKNLRK